MDKLTEALVRPFLGDKPELTESMFFLTETDIVNFICENDLSKILSEGTYSVKAPTDDGPPIFYKTFSEYKNVSKKWLDSMFERTGWKVMNYILSDEAIDPELDYTLSYGIVPAVAYGKTGDGEGYSNPIEKYKKRQKEINRELGWAIIKWMGILGKKTTGVDVEAPVPAGADADVDNTERGEKDKKVNEQVIVEAKKSKNVVIYPGRFQPFHKGHYYSYQDLVKKFGKENVYVATSNKTEPEKSPFNFSEKKTIISKMFGIPANHIIQVKSPYNAGEYTKLGDSSIDSLVVALGEKDAKRLSGGKFYDTYSDGEKLPFSEKGYVYTVPQLQMKLDGETISGSVVRRLFKSGTNEQRIAVFKKLYGKLDKKIFAIIVKGLGGTMRNEVFSVNWWKNELLMEDESEILLDESRGLVKCVECGNWMKQIQYRHLKYSHDMTMNEYRIKYPNAPLLTESSKNTNSTGKNLMNDTDVRKNHLKTITSDTYSHAPINTRILLQCGGAYGHLSHPFDDWNLTFKDLRTLIMNALEGKLDMAQEKTDGQNLMVSWKNNKLVAARNKSHIKNFGEKALDKNALSQMFAGRAEIHDAFVFSMEDLESAISKLSDANKDAVFAGGKKFMSLEVFYPKTENTVPYGLTMLVFHGTMEYDEKGNPIGEDKKAGKVLNDMIKKVNANIQKHFTLSDNPILKLPKAKDYSTQKSYFLNKLNTLQKKFKLKDTDKVLAYHKAWWEDFITKEAKKQKYDIPKTVFNNLVERWGLKNKKAFTIPQMKKQLEHDKFREWALKYDKTDKDAQIKTNIKPFEYLFLELGVKLAQNLSELLAVNPDKAIQKMKAGIDQVAKELEGSDDVKKIEKFKTAMESLKAIGGMDAIVPSEGLTFMWRGKLWKLTGSFTPIHRILSMMKFV